jgi:hypothetical protein
MMHGQKNIKPTEVSNGERSGICRGRDIGPPPAVHRLGGLMLRHFVPHGRRRVVEHGRVETDFHILLLVYCHQFVRNQTTVTYLGKCFS